MESIEVDGSLIEDSSLIIFFEKTDKNRIIEDFPRSECLLLGSVTVNLSYFDDFASGDFYPAGSIDIPDPVHLSDKRGKLLRLAAEKESPWHSRVRPDLLENLQINAKLGEISQEGGGIGTATEEEEAEIDPITWPDDLHHLKSKRLAEDKPTFSGYWLLRSQLPR